MKTKMNMHDWAQQIFASKKCTAIPIMTHPGIELLGKSVRDAVCNGEIHAIAIQKLNEIYPADATTVIMDLTVEAEAFGAPIIFPENEVPAVTSHIVSDFESVQALEIPSLETGRIQEYLKANTLTAKNIIGKPVFAGMIGPFSLAGRLFDMSELMMAIYIEPDTIKLLLEKCTQFLIQYAKALKATQVDGVVIAEPAAGLISNEDAVTFSSQYVKQIVDAVQDETFMTVLHNCGNTGHCTDSMVKTGASALSFGNAFNMVSAFEECPENILLMGNLDPVGLFKQASSAEVKQKTSALIQASKTHPNFILSTGCDVPEKTPFENIEAFYEAVSEYNQSL